MSSSGRGSFFLPKDVRILSVDLQIQITAVIRRASSGCCSAKLDGTPGFFTCRACGKPCERILCDPEEVVV
jgi:hypothetical protein